MAPTEVPGRLQIPFPQPLEGSTNTTSIHRPTVLPYISQPSPTPPRTVHGSIGFSFDNEGPNSNLGKGLCRSLPTLDGCSHASEARATQVPNPLLLASRRRREIGQPSHNSKIASAEDREAGSNPRTPDVSSLESDLSKTCLLDPLIGTLAQVQLAKFLPPSLPELQCFYFLAPSDNISSDSTTDGRSPENLKEEKMVATRHARSQAAREATEPYRDTLRRTHEKIPFDSLGNVHEPSSSSSGTLSPSPAGNSIERQRQERAKQEESDRQYALRLANEEELVRDLRAPPTLEYGRSSMNTTFRSYYPDSQGYHHSHAKPTQGCEQKVSRADPVVLDSDDDEAKDGFYRPSQRGSTNADHKRVEKEWADARLAQFLQEEEQEAVKGRLEKTSLPTRECLVCGEVLSVHDFPSLQGCAHRAETCAQCYQGWIASELSNKTWNDIQCPGEKCQVILKHHEVQEHATPEVYEKFDELSARSALSDDPNFRWCRGPGCQNGQIHVNGEEGNIFQCAACGFKVCFKHEFTWHEGETCDDYDYRVSGQKEEDERRQEEASIKAIGKFTKKCPGPNCAYNIEKNQGCNHMTCSRCRYEFCWLCFAPWGQPHNGRCRG